MTNILIEKCRELSVPLKGNDDILNIATISTSGNAFMGGVIDPHAAYLVLRGLKTLSLRVERHNDNAMRLARRLEGHPKIEVVHYPGLESHPDHEVAKKYMKGFGGVVSFEIKGDLWTTAKFIDYCELPYIAPSLASDVCMLEQSRSRTLTHGLRYSQYGM